MSPFSCDQCGQIFDDQQRFIVRMESYPDFAPDLVTECDLDLNQLDDLASILEAGTKTAPECETQSFRYELCRGCYQRFLRNPLTRDLPASLKFSPN